MRIDIDELTERELIELNNRVVEKLRLLAQVQVHREMMEFRIGQRVSFDPEGRATITGILTKFNRKTVTVVCDNGQRWNVSPGYLREAEPRDAVPESGNIVPIKSNR